MIINKFKKCFSHHYDFKLLLIVNLIIVNTFMLNGQEKLTPYKIVAGGTLNSNLYFSNFSELTGYPSCCTNYDFATGFGYSFFTGVEYTPETLLFGYSYSYDFLVSYNNLSAKYAIEEKLANIITGNKYIEAFSEHSLDAQIYSINIEPGFNISPFQSLPLSIRLGFNLGVLFGQTFIQKERILSPDWITYKETGTQIKYHYSGDIPDASQFYSAITLGFRYEAMRYGNYSISPILNFSYGLSNVTSNTDWKISSLQAGISIGYNIPKPKNIPPMEAPLPLLPKPPEPKEMIVKSDIYSENKKLNNNDTLNILVKERRFINRFILLPIVFYQINTDEMLVSDNMHRSEEEAQKNAYLSAIQYLKDKPDVTLTLYSSSLNTENAVKVKSRLDRLIKLIADNSISQDRIRTKEIIIDASKLSRSELEQDNCFIRFDFSDGAEIISYKSDTLSKFIVEPVEINISPNVNSELKLSEFTGEILLNKKIVHNFGNEKSSFYLKPDISELEDSKVENNIVEIAVRATDVLGKTKSDKKTLILKLDTISDKVFENVISDVEEQNYVRQFTLGYCEFDKAEFTYVNKFAVEQIKQAVNSGEIIEIIPLFDFLGTEEHNLKLATSRANSAMNLLGITKEQVSLGNVKINIPKDYFFSNENPYGRMMNRTVIVRIKNISGN